MRLRSLLQSGTAAVLIAAVAASPTGAVTPPPSASTRAALQVRYGQAAEYTRLEFHWAGGAGHTLRRNGQVLTLSFTRDAVPDVAELRNLPPRFVLSLIHI